jgi:hypothetical protein
MKASLVCRWRRSWKEEEEEEATIFEVNLKFEIDWASSCSRPSQQVLLASHMNALLEITITIAFVQYSEGLRSEVQAK